MPHSMKYPITCRPAAFVRAAGLERPAAASGTAITIAASTATVATKRPWCFTASPPAAAVRSGSDHSTDEAASHAGHVRVNCWDESHGLAKLVLSDQTGCACYS